MRGLDRRLTKKAGDSKISVPAPHHGGGGETASIDMERKNE